MDQIRNQVSDKIKNTIEGIFNLRMIFDKYQEVMGKDGFVCFIDYEKAFDRVDHTQQTDTLKITEIDGNDLRIIQTLYWNPDASLFSKSGRGRFIGRVCDKERGYTRMHSFTKAIQPMNNFFWEVEHLE